MQCINFRWQRTAAASSSRGRAGSRPCVRRPLMRPSSPTWARASPPAAPLAAAAPAAVSSSSPADLEKDTSGVLSLSNIRQSLIRQEDTIIFALIERAQFARNDAIYRHGGFPVPCYTPEGHQYSFLEYVLRETEQMHGRIRRYTSPDEHAYFPDCIPPLVLPPISFPKVLAHCGDAVNINDQIMAMYLDFLLPGITQPGDDHNYGSAAIIDVTILQALSKRIHYGKFVAEAKFQAHTFQYTELIKRQDAAGILDLLTDKAVELRVIERVRRKAATFGQDVDALPSSSSTSEGSSSSSSSNSGGSGDSNGGHRLPAQHAQHSMPEAAAAAATPAHPSSSFKINPDLVARLYEQSVMPLTKEVEVQYLLRRLD